MMRTVVLLLALGLMFCRLNAQIRIDDHIDNKKISEVLADWSERYNVDFAFDSYELARYRFEGIINQRPLDEAIRLILTDSPFTFRWVDATCIIYPMPAAESIEHAGNTKPQIIAGQVTDRLNRERLPFASVGLVRANAFTTTDSDGNFTLFTQPDIFIDTLVVVYIGYQTFQMPLDLTRPAALIDIQLIASNSYLPDVEIRATSVKPMQIEPEPGSVTITPNASVLRFGVGESDIFRLAQFSSGVSIAV